MATLFELEFGTHCYVGTLTCGCGTSIVRDMPGALKDTAKDVADMIKRGLLVTRLPNTEASDLFQAQCANYPHEGWQKRIEAARQKRSEVLPLSSGEAVTESEPK